jgi:cell division protein FtsL
LLAIAIGVLTAIGIVRVRASVEVLALGGEITELTEEQSRLLEERRRLSAERAYLRHPDQIEVVARKKLGMVPISPELVQEIQVVEEADAP